MRVITRSIFYFLALLAVTPALADASAERGRDIYWAKCIGCHSFGCNRYGPKLEGVVGRKAGTVTDFKHYSDALKNSGLIWSIEHLDRFFMNPTAMFPEIRLMDRLDLPLESPKDRSDLIAYLKSGDTSLDLCPK